jgi:hypothetical protein
MPIRTSSATLNSTAATFALLVHRNRQSASRHRESPFGCALGKPIQTRSMTRWWGTSGSDSLHSVGVRLFELSGEIQQPSAEHRSRLRGPDRSDGVIVRSIFFDVRADPGDRLILEAQMMLQL